MDRTWKRLSRELVVDTPYYKVALDHVVRPDGAEDTYVVAMPHDAVYIVTVTVTGRIVLVRQYRYTLDAETLEIPAGMLKAGTDPLEQAQHELEEEVGCRAPRVELIHTLKTSPGRQNQSYWIVLATGLPDGALSHANQEGDESISEVLSVSWDHLMSMIDSGELRDTASIAALLLYARRAGLPITR